MIRRVVIIALVALLPRAASACQCIRGNLDAAFRFSRDVVIGNIVKIEGASHGFHKAVVYVEVERSWKGARAGSTIAAYSSLTEVDCGRGYEVGERVVFTTVLGDCKVFAGGMCSWTAPVEVAKDSIARLDRWSWWWRLPVSKLLHGRGEQAPDRCTTGTSPPAR